MSLRAEHIHARAILTAEKNRAKSMPMQMSRRSNFGWYDGCSVPSLFQAMHDTCDALPADTRRTQLQDELKKLVLESQKPPSIQNHEEIRDIWNLVKPELRTFGIWRGFDSPPVKAKILGFVIHKPKLDTNQT